MSNENDKNKDNHIDVVVITTSGVYPSTGTDSVPTNQKIEQQLKKAVKELKITDTASWVAKVANQTLNVGQSYSDNGLSGAVRIDYRREHGGGGCA